MGRPLEAMDRMSALRVRDVTMIAAMGVAGGGDMTETTVSWVNARLAERPVDEEPEPRPKVELDQSWKRTSKIAKASSLADWGPRSCTRSDAMSPPSRVRYAALLSDPDVDAGRMYRGEVPPRPVHAPTDAERAWVDMSEKASRITHRMWHKYGGRADPVRRVISALCAEYGYREIAEALAAHAPAPSAEALVATDYAEPS